MPAEIEGKVKDILEMIQLVGLQGLQDEGASKTFLLPGFVGEATKDGVIVDAKEENRLVIVHFESKTIKVNKKGKMEFGNCEKIKTRLSRFGLEDEIVIRFGDKILAKSKKPPILRATLSTDDEYYIETTVEGGLNEKLEFEETDSVDYPYRTKDNLFNDLMIKMKVERFRDCLADAKNLKNQEYEFQVKLKDGKVVLVVDTNDGEGDGFSRDIPATIQMKEEIDLPYVESFSTGLDAIFSTLDEEVSLWMGALDAMVLRKENERYKILYLVAPLEETSDEEESESEEDEKDEDE